MMREFLSWCPYMFAISPSLADRTKTNTEFQGWKGPWTLLGIPPYGLEKHYLLSATPQVNGGAKIGIQIPTPQTSNLLLASKTHL